MSNSLGFLHAAREKSNLNTNLHFVSEVEFFFSIFESK